MYLVELRPGKEELYRTTEELAAAIRQGDVDMHSRIYHRATSKWISVTLHPQYKAIIAERNAPPPLAPLERTTWTFFNDSADSLAGANDPSPDEGEQDDKKGLDPNHPWRRPLALSITGGLLILGLELAASGPKPPWSAREARQTPGSVVRPAVQRAPAAEAPSPTVSLVSSGGSWTELNRGYISSPSPRERAAPTETSAAKSAPVLPAAPVIRTKRLLKEVAASPTPAPPAPGSLLPTGPAPRNPTPEAGTSNIRGFLDRWSAAHDSVLARLESGMRVARLNQLFASSRLSPDGGVTETRMSLAGLANFVRIYRQQQAAIEREYQESFTATSKAKGWTPSDIKLWYAKPSRTESATLAGLTTSLIDGIDSLLGVLDAQAGTYTVRKNSIRFEDPAAAREYMALRERILMTVDSARVSGAASEPGPMSYLLQAIGTTRLPLAS
jgi:hypothetical protein